MSLNSLISQNVYTEHKMVFDDVSEERVRQDLPDLQKLVAYWRVYPDKFIDYLCSLNPNNQFRFYYYQRVN